MKLEDIYAGLCVMRHEMNYRREHRRGALLRVGFRVS